MAYSSEEIIKAILHYQERLERYSSKKSDDKMLYTIRKLSKLPIKTTHLEATGVGRTVNALKKLSGEVGDAAKDLVNIWKNMVLQEEQATQETSMDTEEDANSVCSYEPENEDSEKDHDNGDYQSSNEENDTDEYSNRKDVPNKSKYNYEESKSSKYKDNKKHSNKTYSVSKSEEEMPNRKDKHSRKRDHSSESGEDERSRDKYKKLKREKENSKNHHNKEKDKSREENNKKHDKDKHSSSSSSSKNRSDDRNNSNKHKSKTESEDSKHKVETNNKQEDKSSKNKHSSHTSSSYKSSSSHSNSSKKESKHVSENDKEKKSSKKDTSNSKNSNEKKIQESSKEEKKKSKDRESSSTSKEKRSSNSHDKKNKDTKIKDSPIVRKEIIHGIDSESGASFAEALGMCGPIVSSHIKKKSNSEKSRNKPTETKIPDSPPGTSTQSRYIENESSSSRLKAVPNLLKDEPQEPLNVCLSNLLPEITPNYKPIPISLDLQPKRIYNDDEALSRVMSNKNQRTKVYSGNKTVGKVESLFQLCVKVLQDNIEALEYTGGVPYLILKPILERTTPDQLFNMEHHNPYLIEDTDELWQLHCQKDFRTKKREELESWRDMYLRCLDEREAKLNFITANIKQAQDKSIPIRTTKLAYVDSDFVKPPRNIARKQAKNGTIVTDRKTTPSQKLSAIAKSNDAGNVVVPNPGSRAAERSSSSSSAVVKPKKAPLMAKTLSFLKNRFKR